RCWEFGRLWNQIKARVKKPNIGDTYALLVEMAQTGLKALKYRGKPAFAEEKWQKCSLCGERSALIDLDLDKLESDPNYVNETIKKFEYKFKDDLDEKGRRNALYYKRLKDFWKKMAGAFPGHIKENEHLCAVCLVKRLAPKVIYESVKENAKNNQKSPFFESIVKEFDYHYPSTGSIAISPFIKKTFDERVDFSLISETIKDMLERGSDDNGRRKIKNFLDAHFTEGRTVPAIKDRIIDKHIAVERFEGDFELEWFYDESFPRFYNELEDKGENGQKRQWAERIEQAVQEIKKKAKEILGEKYHLPKYYAAVYLDGDHLGKWLRGEFAPKIEDVFHPDFVKQVMNNEHFKKIKNLKRPVTPAIHRAISSALRDFALEVVPYVVEENLGVVVYSGGDDTLFLMPLENLFKTLMALRRLYSGEQFVIKLGNRIFESDKGFIKIYENGELKEIIRVMGTKATLSAGVAIAHYLDPLDVTLSRAKKALEEAKEAGRNKAAFKVILHSGSERKAVVPWNFVEKMEVFRTEISNGFSPRFLRMLYGDIDVYQEIPEAFDAEFLKFGSRGQSKDVKLLLCDLIDARKDNGLPPGEFVDALLIADFVAREEGAK
ncbi:MAG: type III-B CRISPR-associated protein Cas10/Cmr2, partial [Candidatus Hydrothermota bacterium]